MLRRLSVLAAALALLLGPLAAGGSSQSARLTLVERGVFLYLPYEDGQETPRKVFAPRAGERYRVQVDYEVGGAPRIATGHTFVFANAVTGERLKVSSKSFPLGEPGAFNESLTFTIPSSWPPGVYRVAYTLDARAPGLRSVSLRGARSFLLLPPGPGASPPA